jgi:hypothetical protein
MQTTIYHGVEHLILREEESSARQLVRLVPASVPEDEQDIRAFWITKDKLDVPKRLHLTSTERNFLPDSVTNEDRVYAYLKLFPLGMTADEGVERMEKEDSDGVPKVNQVAPVLSKFKKFDIVRWSGTRPTRSSGTAHVNVLTDNSEAIFFNTFGRGPLS